MTMRSRRPAWRKSSYSANVSNCVEVAETEDVLVRDSKLAERSPVLRVDRQAWRRFLSNRTV